MRSGSTGFRIYWEAAHQGCYQIDGGDRLSWDDGGALWIIPQTSCYVRFPAWLVAIARLEEQPRNGAFTWAALGSFVRRVQQMLLRAMEPPEELLLATYFDAAAFRARFDVKCEPQDDKILLTLLPRYESDADWFRKVLVLVDAKSYELVGHCVIRPSGEAVIHTFSETKINEVPPDRNELLWPSVVGLDDAS